MNSVVLIGRVTKNPDVRYGNGSQTAVARFSIAIDRGKDKEGNDLGADFPSVVVFGKTAENVEKFVSKGKLVGVSGRIQTGSYEKDGVKHYTTEVLANRVEFLERAQNGQANAGTQANTAKQTIPPTIPEGFAQLTDDDIPY